MRRLAALALVSLLVAACGSSTPSGSPGVTGATGSAAPSLDSAVPGSPDASGALAAPSEPGASAAPGSSAAEGATPAPGSSTAPGASALAGCAKLNDAIETVDLYTQLLSQVDAANWTDLTGPDSPVNFDIATFKTAMATIAAYPDTSDLSANLKEIARLIGFAQKDPAPFTSGSRVGIQLRDTVQRLFVPVGVAMVKLREAQGCPVQ